MRRAATARLLAVNDRADIARRGGRRRAAPRPGRPAAADRPRHHRPAPGDRPAPPTTARRRAPPRPKRSTTSASARAGRRRPNRAVPRPAWTSSAPPHESRTDKPWFAIGGIDEQRLPEVLGGRCAPRRRGACDHRRRGSGGRGATAQSSACSSGIVAATSRSRSQLAANPGCNGSSATSSSATQRSSELSRLGTVSSSSAASAITVV